MSSIKSPLCGRGHEWNGIRPNGQRYCKKCNKIRHKAYRARLKAAAKKVAK